MGGSVKKESDFKGNQIVELALSHSSLLKKKKMIAGLESTLFKGDAGDHKGPPNPTSSALAPMGVNEKVF